MIWNFSGFTKDLNMFVVYIRFKSISTDFYSGKKCINNINSMFKTDVL